MALVQHAKRRFGSTLTCTSRPVPYRDCKVEDLDVDGMPKSSASKSRYDLDGGAGTVSLLIRVANKDPNKSVVKNHNSIILRAETAAEKYSWLARLKAGP